jgi:glutamate/tyrosine decarboxylase-like PLP-dependent enzyme
MAYGKNGYQSIVENCVGMANYFGQSILATGKFQLLAPIRLNTVCFTLAGEANHENAHLYLSALNKSGKVFMTPTVYNKKGIRAAFVNWRTSKNDIDLAVMEMVNCELSIVNSQ